MLTVDSTWFLFLVRGFFDVGTGSSCLLLGNASFFGGVGEQGEGLQYQSWPVNILSPSGKAGTRLMIWQSAPNFLHGSVAGISIVLNSQNVKTV